MLMLRGCPRSGVVFRHRLQKFMDIDLRRSNRRNEIKEVRIRLSGLKVLSWSAASPHRWPSPKGRGRLVGKVLDRWAQFSI